MPKKGDSGETTVGLLAYLFGPGDRDEHTDPHIVAAWDPALPCPARTPGRMTLSGLGLLLDAPVDALRGPRPAEHVWHVSVRNAPTDRTLTDTEWATVAAEMVAVAGIAPHGDEHGCRWVAVRHAPDHIHIVATLARRDGRGPRIRGDILRMHTAARTFETALGLEPMSPLDTTARRAPATGEKEKAARQGLEEPARETLQRAVRQAAALATDTTDFLNRLRDAGLRVREHHNATTGTVDGYAVALPGDRADHGSRPVWFSGRTLAYDLSLPRIRERYEPALTPADITRAHHRIREAATLLARAGRTEGAGDVAALGDLLTVAATVSPATVRAHVQAAAAAFEQASRAPGARTLDGTARTRFKAATRALEHAPRTARGGAPAVLNLLLALVEAIEAATAWHRAQHHRAQTTAAAQAAVLLREAATLTTTPARTTTPRPAARTVPRTVRVTPAAERGPAASPPVTGVPPRPPTGTHPGPGLGPWRSR
ncbi:mobilization protein [Streptomyces anulatus]|uniref:mobilization protein n=1 Tax=Streptomyces anulatus TaxID=1892 RepID=UPI0036397722